MRKHLVFIAALAIHAATNTATAAETGKSCATLKDFKIAGMKMQIVKAEEVAAGISAAAPGGPPGPPAQLPAHCRIEGVIDPRTGRDGKPYAIRFAVALPTQWNGRFLFQGGGGLNGSLSPPIGAAAAGDISALMRGFAVASTDSGHASAIFDASFFNDQEATINFLYQAGDKVTVAAKQIIAARYGTLVKKSYYVGCSMGGREAMTMSQRFPTYFDGIVAGSPAMRTSFSNLATRWVTTSLNTAAPKDADGKLLPSKALSDGDRKLFIDALLQACDANDGAKDGLIAAPHRCNFDPQVLTCKKEKTDACLSSQQISAIKKGFAGPKALDGRQVYPGFYYDTGLSARGFIPGLLIGGSAPEGPAPIGATMNVDAEAAVANDARAMAGDTNAWTNLSTYTGHGGKLIFYHGVSDPWFSAQDTVQYYERLAKDNGNTPIDNWSRLFLVPGMGHCAGGAATLDQFDMVDAIMKWVEEDKAPDQVIATGRSMPGVSRPLCPYPKHAHYNGSGDVNAAETFSCKE